MAVSRCCMLICVLTVALFGPLPVQARMQPANRPAPDDGTGTSMPAARSAPVVAVFRADWCPKCKLLEPRLQAITAAYERRGVRFVVFDLTNRMTKNAARLQAANAQILDAYDRHAAQPGFAVVIPVGSDTAQTVLNADDSTADLMAKLNAALPEAAGR